MDIKYKQNVTQRIFLDYYLTFCANIYNQKRLSFLRRRETYTNTTWDQKDMKMAPSRGRIKWKKNSFVQWLSE